MSDDDLPFIFHICKKKKEKKKIFRESDRATTNNQDQAQINNKI
jgi:hypothetical protein